MINCFFWAKARWELDINSRLEWAKATFQFKGLGFQAKAAFDSRI